MADINATGIVPMAVDAAAAGNLLGVFESPIPMVVNLGGNLTGNPRVASAEARSHIRVRVNFDQPMTDDSRLRDPNTYTIISLGAGVNTFVTNVIPDPSAFPAFVDLDTNEMTGGEGYQARVESGPGSPVNQIGLPMAPAGSVASFIGVGQDPTVVTVAGITENLVDVTFSENMLDNASIRDITKYVFDNGLSVLAVLEVVGNRVRLVTDDQVPELLYTLTIG